MLFSTHGACDDAWMADHWAERGGKLHRRGFWGCARGRGRGKATHHHLDVASVLTLVRSCGSGHRVRQEEERALWMIRRGEGFDGTQGGRGGWPVWLWLRCFCRSYRYSGQEVWMDARVRSGWLCPYAAVSSRRCQGQEAGEHETLAGRGRPASRNPRHLPKPRQRIRGAQLAARQADRRRYGVHGYLPPTRAGIT